MSEYTIRSAAQMPGVIRALRMDVGLTQVQVAQRLGVRQQTISQLERNAENVSVERLMKLLGVLGIELVLRNNKARSEDMQAALRRNGDMTASKLA